MPKEITHWSLAEKIYQGIGSGSDLERIIARYKHLYLLGAVIPDTPFYRLLGQEGKMMTRVGRGIHDTPKESYAPILRVIRAYNPLPDPVLSLLLGVFTHIHADSSFHPMVYYFSGSDKDISIQADSAPKGDPDPVLPTRTRDATIFHHLLENYMDIYYAHEQPPPNNGLFYQILKNQEMTEDALLKVLAVLFSGKGETISRSCIKRTLELHAGIQRLFDKDAAKIILMLADIIPGVDTAVYRSSFYPLRKPDSGAIFRRPFLYRHPVTGQEIQETIKQIEERAVRETLERFRFIESFIGQGPVAGAFVGQKGPNLCTGIPGVTASEMRYFSAEKNLMKLVFHGSVSEDPNRI